MSSGVVHVDTAQIASSISAWMSAALFLYAEVRAKRNTVFGVGFGKISVDIELRTEENFAAMLMLALVQGPSMWLSLVVMCVYSDVMLLIARFSLISVESISLKLLVLLSS